MRYFSSRFCHIFRRGSSAFLEISSRKQYPNFYSDKLLECDTQHHIFTFSQFRVAENFDELFLSMHWQFELVPCSHTGKARFIEVFFEVGLPKTVDHELLLPNWCWRSVLATFRSNLKYIRIQICSQDICRQTAIV